MTEKPLDSYIKSPPPSDERSHFNYLEEQFTKLENVSKNQVVRIGDNNESAKALILQEANARVDGDSAQATYTQTVAAQTLASATALVNTEATARTTADSALASQITTLNANVGTLSGSITSEASLRVSGDEALGTRIDNLVLSNGSSAAVIIDSEASARITADYALGARIDSLTTTVNSNTAAISTEQTARSTRDDAVAKQLFTMSSGSARIYIATSAPGSTGRQAGDVWFDSSSSNNYKPYVWARSTPTATSGTYDWRDNSDGSFTNLVGNYAVYTNAITTLTNATTSQASSITALQTTVGDSTAGLVKDVSALSTTVGGASSGLVKDVTTLQSTTAQQRIYRQGTQPSTATADRKVGDLWYDTSNGNTVNYWNGTAWVPTTDTTRASQASLTTEQSARTTADTALASYLMSASAGTSRVYTSDPGTTGRQNGDVWIKPEENFKQYVWYNSAWRDNSDGSYSQYVGQLASVTSTANAAYTTAGSAQTAASNATTIANQASSTAGAASTTAGTAKSIAETAQGVADIATGVANTAKSTADSAKLTADDAKSTAVSVASQVNALSATVTDNKTSTDASIQTVQATVASNNTALSGRIDTLSSTVTDNYNTLNASIQGVSTTVTNNNNSLAAQINTVSATASKQRVFRQADAPPTTDRIKGDLWYDNTGKPYYFDGTAWVDNSDGRFGSIPTIFSQTSAPSSTGRVNGDLWFDTDDNNRQYYWNGSAWVDRSDARLTTIPSVYYQTTQPTGKVVGDVWFDTDDNNQPWYYDGSSWQSARDTSKATVAQVTNETTARVNADQALASAITAVSTGSSRVYTQSTNPGSSGRQTGDIWISTDENFKPYVWYGGQWNDNSTGQYTQYVGQYATISQTLSTTTTTANTANTTANNALSTANSATTTANNAAATANTASTDVSTAISTANGAASIANTAKNTADSATTTANNAASTATTANNAAITAVSTANQAATTANNLSYEWRVQGTIDGVTGGLRLQGAKRYNQSTGLNETTTDLIIDANTTINGSLVVNGTISTPKLANNSVSNTAYSQGNGNSGNVTITLRAGARVSILATYAGGDDQGLQGHGGTLRATVNGGNFTNNTTPLRYAGSITTAGSYAYISYTTVVTSVVTAYVSSPATLLTFYTAPSDGQYTIKATAEGGFGQLVSLLVMELAK